VGLADRVRAAERVFFTSAFRGSPVSGLRDTGFLPARGRVATATASPLRPVASRHIVFAFLRVPMALFRSDWSSGDLTGWPRGHIAYLARASIRRRLRNRFK